MAKMLYEDPKLQKMNSELKKARFVSGHTQESLSESSGVNIKSIASYEQDPEKLTVASYKTVKSLADSLGVDTDDIINMETIYGDKDDDKKEK
jgi:transcriptional regulator with XRE-family HTH domain